MTDTNARSRCQRWLAGLLSLLIGLGPIATPAYAALTLLADEPLNIKNQSKPNIVLTVDDSTSMLFDFLPDYVAGRIVIVGGKKQKQDTFCRDGTGKMAALCGEGGLANDFSAQGYGRFTSPGYISAQWKIPYATYASGYDASGPGAGCDLLGFPPKCSGGIDPTLGNSVPVGIERYPSISPLASEPYEYWTLWPAPVHNGAFNRIYYDPTVDYIPPVNPDGSTLPTMDALFTTNWTKVPADRWSANGENVDLTTSVTVGQWCNADWTQGINPATGKTFVSDAAFCRTNGLIAAAAGGAPKADGDYTYPWVPSGIRVDDSPNIALSIANTKVNPGNKALLPAWTAAQDAKYFYENDNVIWCDTTSKLWPQGGTTQAQTCNGAQPQTCGGGTSQTCGGGSPQSCSAQTQSCNGATPQTCQNINQAQTCSGATSQTCNGAQSQTCGGVQGQSCVGYAPQTCGGAQTNSCGGISSQTCNGVQGQTCTNLHEDTGSGSCVTAYSPPGCNTCVGPECPKCTLKTTCPIIGNCSIQTGNVCTSNAQCPTLGGTCSKTGGGCFTGAECPNSGNCTVGNATCTSDANCPNVTGTCSASGAGCSSNADCPAAGKCSVQNTTTCTSNANCPTLAGNCSIQTASACFITSDCGTAPGQCSSTLAACTSNANCPPVTGSCNLTGNVCNGNGDCGLAGRCSQTNAACTTDANCPTVAGSCNLDSASCTSNASCGIYPGKCSTTNAVCTTPGSDGANCPNTGKKCSIDNNACTSDSNCAILNLKCSIDGNACVNQGAACTTVPGKCSITATSCSLSSDCADINSASAGATCSDMTSDYSKTLLADAAGVGAVCRRNNQDYGGVSAGRFNYPDSKYNFPVTGGLGAVTVWVEDAAPAGAVVTGDEAWNWINNAPTPYSGASAHQSALAGGEHQHYFYGASTPLAIDAGDSMFTYVYLDPVNPPSEIMLQFNDQYGSWEHRGYWGANLQPWGADNTVARRYMGPLPPTGRWVRLAIPASMIGLEGLSIGGMAFTLYDGRATWDYAGKAASALKGNASTLDACMPTQRFASIPRHYWKTSVEWCDQAVVTAGDKWALYGTPVGGSCQYAKDASHVYPRFYKFGTKSPPDVLPLDTSSIDNYGTPAFERVDLDIAKRGTATFSHTFKDDTGTVTITRNFDQEMTNYANWFAYYRTRIQAVKSVTSLAFKELDDKYRVGFHTLSNNPKTSFVNIADFTPAQKTAWYQQLFDINIKLSQETPNLDAIVRIGEYYRTGGNAELSGATDPIVLSCQKNVHMLFTDGLTNQPALPTTTVGNADDIVPSLPASVLGLTVGSSWPPPYREDSLASSSNSAADYATFYWVTDLRTTGPTAPNNVPASIKDCSKSTDPVCDSATWQHVNFAAMSLGTEGKLPSLNQGGTESDLRSGALQWPQPLPNVYQPNESGVDDLWHAAVNGRGRFVNADSADDLKIGMGQILLDALSQGGARIGVGFDGVNITATNKFVYRARFEPGWGGSLSKIEIDPKTGAEVAVLWNAADQLSSQLTIAAGKPTPWFTERMIVTTDSTGKRVPFLWNNLTATQQDWLAPGKPKRGQAILEFLRGNRLNEGIKKGQLRLRAGPLGDIADSQPVIVGAPKAPYTDTDDPGYAAFKAAQASRPKRVYVGANDGMLHAFDDANGNETWAYVPLAVHRAPPAPPGENSGLGALAYQDGALPAFRHHFYVDASPKVADVDFGSQDWHSLMVGGLGHGGRSYYAVDITDPTAFSSETEVAKKILWEFSDPDMGYTYGKPIITKTRGFGGKWVVILPSGYNNLSGEGKLFIVDAVTGKLLKTMTTGVGNSASPSGLGHVAGYTQDYRNLLTEQVYGGDLLGNFWRFDTSDSNASKWKVEKLATLTDGSNPQPVTTPPQIEIDIQNGVDRWVFVGTGKLYHESDIADVRKQSLYAIRDGTATVPGKIGKLIDRGDLIEVKDEVGLTVKPDVGWYDDLPPGQRIVVPPQGALSVVAYTATSAQDDPCLTGQPATIYAREFSTGASLLVDTGTGNIIESVLSSEGGVGLELLALDNGGGEVPNIVLGVTLGTTGVLKTFKIKLPSLVVAHRMSWRLLSE